VLVLVALAASMPAVAVGQTVCDRLIPIGLVPPAGGFVLGCAYHYVLRQGSVPPPASSWVPVRFPVCPNGPCAGLTGPLEFGCEATSGYFCCMSAGDSIPLVAGVYVGPLSAGFSQRFANDTDTRTNICFSDYVGNGSRLANVPLIHSFGAGTTQVQVTGFERMFLLSPPATGVVMVEFVAQPTPARSRTWGRTKVRYR
jgi:hypothetical protein